MFSSCRRFAGFFFIIPRCAGKSTAQKSNTQEKGVQFLQFFSSNRFVFVDFFLMVN